MQTKLLVSLISFFRAYNWSSQQIYYLLTIIDQTRTIVPMMFYKMTSQQNLIIAFVVVDNMAKSPEVNMNQFHWSFISAIVLNPRTQWIKVNRAAQQCIW